MLYTMACERVLFKQGFSGTFLSDNFCWLKVSLIMQSIALLRIIVAVKYSFSQFSKYVNMDSQFCSETCFEHMDLFQCHLYIRE